MGASSASIGTICYSSEPAAGHHETGRSPLSSVEETELTSKQVERRTVEVHMPMLRGLLVGRSLVELPPLAPVPGSTFTRI